MIQKKICLLGAFSVGKTSLIQQYVNSIFDEKYLTTIGVKVDKKVVETGVASGVRPRGRSFRRPGSPSGVC